MSDIAALTELFKSCFNAPVQANGKKPVVDMAQFDEGHNFTQAEQQAAAAALKTGSALPESYSELNDMLRATTYLLGTQQPTAIDSVTLARAMPTLQTFSTEQIQSFRHVVRWARLVQDVLQVPEKANFATEGVEVPREQKVKEKKKEAAAEAATAPAAAAKESEAKPEGAKGEKKPKAKKEAKEKPKKAAPAPAREVGPGMIDLRVGFIRKAIRHPDADSLYVSTIDVGEEEPRTICSGLVNFVPIEDMQERFVVVVANLKPVKMRGIVSNGMVLCASTPDHSKVEFINPPCGSLPGDKIFFENYDEEPETQLNPKKKHWEQIQPNFSTSDDFEVTYTKEGGPVCKLMNKKGEVLRASSIKQAFVS